MQAQKKNTSTAKSAASRNNAKTEAENKTMVLQVPEGLFSVQDLERRRKEALEEIELTSQLLKETSASAKSSLYRLNLLSQQLTSRKKIVSLLGEEIAAIDRRIKTMSDEITILDSDLTKTKGNYAKSMQNQQQEHRTTQYKMLLILSAENISQSYRRMRYLREYADWQKEEGERIAKKQNEITLRKAELEKTRQEKQDLFTLRANESKALEVEEKLQQQEVRDLNKKQKDLQGQLQQKKKETDALNRQIDNLIAEDIKNSEKNTSTTARQTTSTETASSGTGTASGTGTVSSRTGAASNATTTRPASTNSYILTESETSISKNFAGNKGKHPFPVTGRYTIVSHFGEQQHQQLSYVRTNNNGIDIQTTAGAEARAIYKGVVTRVFVMPGFNNNVIIRHGNYLTVYSNLSNVYVKAGDAVDTKQTIGKIFSDYEKGNETILHFQIWYERTKLNPTAWIR
jgi:septal ring factor EnvC (AmiA/AmiB activator)